MLNDDRRIQPSRAVKKRSYGDALSNLDCAEMLVESLRNECDCDGCRTHYDDWEVLLFSGKVRPKYRRYTLKDIDSCYSFDDWFELQCYFDRLPTKTANDYERAYIRLFEDELYRQQAFLDMD